MGAFKNKHIFVIINIYIINLIIRKKINVIRCMLKFLPNFVLLKIIFIPIFNKIKCGDFN